jgi:putative membrane protein
MSNIVLGRPAPDVRTGRPRSWSARRIGGATVLAAWAVLFWFLLLSGRDALYLSTRTSWVVPVGAVLLTAASFGRLASARTRTTPAAMTPREAWVLAAMVVPVVLLLALPPATLGSFSAGKRTPFAASAIAATAGDAGSGALSFIDVAAAQTSKEGQAALAKRAAESVDFVGFVIRYPDTRSDEFMLTRYIVTCCVADATVAQVRVVDVPPGSFATNDWVEVKGTIYPLSGREILVDATSIVAVPRPEHPYLTP